jgi:hypothetical protein
MDEEISTNTSVSAEAVDRPAPLPPGLEKVDVIGLVKNLSVRKVAAVVVVITLANYLQHGARHRHFSSPSLNECYKDGVKNAFFAIGINHPYIEIAQGRDGIPRISATGIGGAGIVWARQFSHYTLLPRLGVSEGAFVVKNWSKQPHGPAMEAVATFARAGEITVKGSSSLSDIATGLAITFQQRLSRAFEACAGSSHRTSVRLTRLGL